MLETKRLILRELTREDFDPLYRILSDPETMRHYPAPFSPEKVQRWIDWNLDNYRAYGFGLWAVILKETGAFLGDCGITMQRIHGKLLPEIGYHIRRDMQRRVAANEKRMLESLSEEDIESLTGWLTTIYDNLSRYEPE